MKTIVDLTEDLKEYSLEKDTAAKQAVEANIAPVEADASSASRAYVVGEQLFLNDVLYDVTSPISVGYAIVVGTNITAANKLSADIQTLKNKVTDISEVMGKNGAKNKEPFDIDVVKALNTTGTWTGNSYALNGITFAFADDGKATVSGTASALCSINISGNYDLNGDYIITGCPSGGGSSTYSLRIYDSSATVVADDIGEGISFTANNLANCRTNIIVRKDAAFSTPIVFAPMIRDSKDPDATYQPYAKTNQELTAENQTLTNQVTDMVNVLGAKNLMPNNAVTTTVNGITFTVNNNGSITANGTATGDDYTAYIDFAINIPIKNGTYIFSGLSDGSTATYSAYVLIDGHYYTITDSPLTFTVLQNTTITRARFTVRKGQTITNVTLYPMLRLASDPDDTYVPYAKTNQQLTQDSVTWDDLSEVGAVNLLQNNATTQTINGVTFTVNSDRTIIVNGVNTSTSAFGYEIDAVGDNFVLPAGSYKLTGCPSNGGDRTWRLQAYKTDGTTIVAIDTGNGAAFTLTEPTQLVVKIRIGGSAGSGTITNLTFKPMIAPVSYNGPYVPPAKTNKELTDDVGNIDKQMSYINPVSATMNIYMTSDAIPTFGSLTNQDATDIAQAMYDLYKKIGGKPEVRFGKLSYFWRKKSDGTQLGSGNGIVEIINTGGTYDDCLSDNSKTRMRISLKDYGYCMTTDYALWGSIFTYLRRGTDTNGTVTDQHQKETIGTISTYVG